MAVPSLERYLAPTATIDSSHPRVVEFVRRSLAEVGDDSIERAVALYYAVRDGIWYDPYLPFYRPEHYRASRVLALGRAFCVGKATLLCAAARLCRIPARVGFADVRNHLATKELLEFLGSNVFAFHGYTELYLNGKWVKATPAFNVELCRKHRVAPLEFNGCEDSVFHPFNDENRRFMEYIADHGTYADIPVKKIMAAWESEYGRERVRQWIADFEAPGGGAVARDFASEDIVK